MVKLKNRTSNIERPTSNNVFCQFKKRRAKWIYPSKFYGLVFYCSLILKSIKRSVINIRRSMFDVQSKPGIEAVNLIKMDTLIYGVSYERRLWPEKRPVWSIKKLGSLVSVNFGLWERFLTAIARVNRGWKPLPPAINHSLNDIELNVVSYERFRVQRRRRPEKRPVWSKKKLLKCSFIQEFQE